MQRDGPKSRDTETGERLLAHVANGTTDRTDAIRRVPVSHYLDEARWRREMDAIFRRLPLMLAFSSELAEPGAFRALDVVGAPVLILRGRDGVARAFLNVCSHRGARLLAEESGRCSRLVCPYHAWAYDDRGALVGIFKASQFGELDKSTKGLAELPCEEVAGLIFVGLARGTPLDVRGYLGGMLGELESLGLADWKLYDRRVLETANWKATFDGYVDGYHLEVLHPKSVGRFTKGAVNTFEAFGPHQKIGFANQDIAKLRDRPSSEWLQDEGFGFVRTLFPSTSLAVTAGVGGLVSQLIPGPTPDRSRTIQSYVYRKLPEGDDERARLDAIVDMFYRAVRDEDSATVDAVQRGMESGALDEVVFGRNEVGNQRLHAWVGHYADGEPRPDEVASQCPASATTRVGR